MGMGADGGCGTEEKPCPISRVPTKSPSNDEKGPRLGLDLYTQARKALAERSPFDTDDAQVSVVPTLPTELANLLSRNSDSRKRHRNARQGPSEKARGHAIWAETEEYFREFALDDVEELHKLCSLGFLGSDKWFLIPNVGDAVPFSGSEECSVAIRCAGVEEEVKEEVDCVHSVEVGSIDKEGSVTIREEIGCSSSGIEWLLGSKEKVHLTTERPSKKRKLLGGSAGLEKLFVSRPVKGSSSLCDYCGMCDTGDQLNRLIICCSCHVAVHQRCYGVQDNTTGSWLCNFCKSSYLTRSCERPCVLCPKKGGALKPASKSGTETENGGYTEFAHLFCCQWIPEVYIHDTRTMEPVMNIEGIKDTRMKLVCNVCKVKFGACVRCSNGTCRTSFHPICAREAGNRMEIWGKFGSDDVELRAYCSKHSEYQNGTNTQHSEQLPLASCSDSHDTKHQTVTPVLKIPHKLKIGRRNGDKAAVLVDPADTEKPGNDLLHEEGLSDAIANSRFQTNCDEARQPFSTLDRITNDDASTSDSLDYTMILKKLIDRGKVNLKDVATEIGVSPDSLASISSDNHLAPHLHSKIVTWLKNNAHIGCLQKNLKVRIKSSLASKDEKGVVKDSNSVLVASPDVPVNSVSPHRTKSKIKILKGNKVISPIEGETGDGLVMDDKKSGEVIPEDADNSQKEHISAPTEKLFVAPDGINEKLSSNSPKCEEGSQEQGPALLKLNTVQNSVPKKSTCSILKKVEVISTYYVHPVIREKIMEMKNAMLPIIETYEVNGSRDGEVSCPEVSSSINELIEHLNSGDKISRFDGSKLEPLADARNIELLKTSPGDEVEGELLFHQHSLLRNAVATKRIADEMITGVVKSLPQERDVTSKRKWDAVIVNQYLSVLKEAKKQGRKERRHKEAQEVLSAATAAAAASSRISSLRKDTVDESDHRENLMKASTYSGRSGSYSQQMPRAKETLSKLAVPRISSELKSGVVQPVSNFNREHARTCDICMRPDTFLNPILVCSGCKVDVHLDCYRSVEDSTGPWYCELCEELSLRSSGDLAVNSWERQQLAVECGLCGYSSGAFRKSVDGQWIHAFCAEWILESTFKRGQATPIEGMESIVKGSECHICHRNQGVCIKCNYGHCHSMFHPSCARSDGLYMNVKSSGNKLLHKAYCQKHSLEQRTKVESQRHGIEELKSLKQIRVELERLRLLCERIIKREKLKRELVLCSQDVLVSNRDNAALSALVHSPFFPNDTSSESATTSLRGNTDDCRSGSEAIQRSDDITVDSTVPGKRRIKFPLSKDSDRKTDDSSTSHLVMHKPRERISFGGKQIPHRPPPFVSQNLLDGGGDKKSKSRRA